MPVTKVIRYKTTPESADENERLIRAVFAELASDKPDGLHYASFRLDDGVSFLHVAVVDGDENQADIQKRLAEGPIQADARAIGSYRLLPD
jgi:hypothetical protein